jgi:hypothetical protein
MLPPVATLSPVSILKLPVALFPADFSSSDTHDDRGSLMKMQTRHLRIRSESLLGFLLVVRLQLISVVMGSLWRLLALLFLLLLLFRWECLHDKPSNVTLFSGRISRAVPNTVFQEKLFLADSEK